MTDSLRENKKGIFKAIIIVLTGFLMVPILTVTIMYFTSENFRYATNDFLTILPGDFGDYFKRIPSEEEEQQIKVQIAQNYIALEEDRLIDKLLIIKGEDKELYNDLLVLLNRENPVKMRNVQEKLRNKELSTDLLKRLLEEIDAEKEEYIQGLANYYASLKLPEAVRELQRTSRGNEVNSEDLALVFEHFNTQEAASYLIHLDSDLTNRINSNLNISARREIEKEIEAIKNRDNNLLQKAKTYQNKSLEEQVRDLGNRDTFRMQDLAVIYRNMPVTNSGEILSHIEDSEFIGDLYDNINMLEDLKNDHENLTVELARTINIYRNYRDKVAELTTIYERMSLNELTEVVENMLRNNRVYQRHTVGSEEIIFREKELVVDVLRRLKPNKVAELMEELDTQMTVELSQRLMEE